MQFCTVKNSGFRYQKYAYRRKYIDIRPVWLFIFCSISLHSFAQSPNLFLLRTYNQSQNVTGWVMSEKLDGVRAYWNGHQLVSRGGNIFNAPEWFLKDFPPFALDGELWTKRNDFENIISIVRQHHPDARWSQISYQVFEVPLQSGGLLERLSVLQVYLKLAPEKPEHLSIVSQRKIKNKTHLNKFFKQIINQDGEGVVVRNPASEYQTGRLKTALKMKSYQDEECEVIGYKPGRGKYTKMVGSLKCKLTNQRMISIGSGLSDQQRKYPPAIGSVITYKHYGLTRKGLPRFPVFLRVRVPAEEGK